MKRDCPKDFCSVWCQKFTRMDRSEKNVEKVRMHRDIS